MSQTSCQSSSYFDRPLFHTRLFLPETLQILSTIDSGVDVTDEELARQLSAPFLPCLCLGTWFSSAVYSNTSDCPTSYPPVCQSSQEHPVSTHIPLILGCPWLCHHNPHIDWMARVMRDWSTACHQVCLKQVSALFCSSSPSVQPDVTGVLPEYYNFIEVFRKAKAMSLAPHRPYDFTIDLQPGVSLPEGCLLSASSLWKEKQWVMETYINNSLATGIHSLQSTAGAGFFFIEKSLRPFINYRGLNNITFKNQYTLPSHLCFPQASSAGHCPHQARPPQYFTSNTA